MKAYQNPRVLENLYWKENLSLTKIAKKFEVTRQTVRYWMKKNKIAVRPPKLECKIPRELLEELYLKKKFSTLQIAKKLGIRSRETIRMKLMKLNISRRNRLEAISKYPKTSFSGNPKEKAYMLGLRAGDISATNNHKQIRVSTSTTHLAQVEMMKKVFSKYSHVHVYPFQNNGKTNLHVYSDLNQSFNFLLKKPLEIPSWILKNYNLFFSFLTGYADAEGCWHLSKNKKGCPIFLFQLETGDKTILEQIKNKLEEFRLNTYFHLAKKKGSTDGFGKRNKDIYVLRIHRKNDVIKLCKKLYPISCHEEKLYKMHSILEHWQNLRPHNQDVE